MTLSNLFLTAKFEFIISWHLVVKKGSQKSSVPKEFIAGWFPILRYFSIQKNIWLVKYTVFGNVYTWQGGLTLELTSSGTVQSMQEQTRRTPKKGNHDWRLEPEKEPLSRNYKSAKCIIKSLCMQAHPIILRGGLHMSCHYQPLIVPSQHFSIYSDSSVPSGGYAWMVKKAGRTIGCVFKPLFVVSEIFICDDYFWNWS